MSRKPIVVAITSCISLFGTIALSAQTPVSGIPLSPDLEAKAAVLALHASLHRDEPAILEPSRLCLSSGWDDGCPGGWGFPGPNLADATLAALRQALSHRAIAPDSSRYQMQRPLLRGDTVVVTTYVTRSARSHMTDSTVFDLDEYDIRMILNDKVLRLVYAENISSSEVRIFCKATGQLGPCKKQ